jgi:3-dehydroquinate dehydratase-1
MGEIMRLESKSKINVKGKIFGGEELLICLPLVSKNKESLIKDLKDIIDLNPDVIEWRIDFFDNLEIKENSELILAMKYMKEMTKEIPVIFTFRHINEGGNRNISQKDRIKIIEKALEIDLADLIDVEMMIDQLFIEEVKTLTDKYKKELILSYHDFKKTPEEKEIINIIKKGEDLGASISKLAVMANSYGDVLKLLNATYESKLSKVEIPIITMAMGNYGKITRVFGGFFGVDMSFASGKGTSAPGQMPVVNVRKILELMNN